MQPVFQCQVIMNTYEAIRVPKKLLMRTDKLNVTHRDRERGFLSKKRQ